MLFSCERKHDFAAPDVALDIRAEGIWKPAVQL